MENTPLLDEVAKLEDDSRRLGSDAARVFRSFGVESLSAPERAKSSQGLKDRLGSLTYYVDEMQRTAASLENELLGQSSRETPAVSSRKHQGLKEQTTAIGDKLTALERSVNAVANAPIVSDIG